MKMFTLEFYKIYKELEKLFYIDDVILHQGYITFSVLGESITLEAIEARDSKDDVLYFFINEYHVLDYYTREQIEKFVLAEKLPF